MQNFTARFPKIYDGAGQEIKVTPEIAMDLVSKGAARFDPHAYVPIIDQTGSYREVLASDLGRVGSFTIATPKMQHEIAVSKSQQTDIGHLKSFAEGALRGPTLGLSDLILQPSGLVDQGAYEARKKDPLSLAGEMAGMLATGGISAGEGALSSAARMMPSEIAMRAGRAAEASLAAKIGESLGSRIASRAAGSAIEGALISGGFSASEKMLDPSISSEQILSEIAAGGMIGAGIGLGGLAVGSALGKAKEAASGGIAKIGESVFGIKKDIAEKYLELKKGGFDFDSLKPSPELKESIVAAYDDVRNTKTRLAEIRSKLERELYEQTQDARLSKDLAKARLEEAELKANSEFDAYFSREADNFGQSLKKWNESSLEDAAVQQSNLDGVLKESDVRGVYSKAMKRLHDLGTPEGDIGVNKIKAYDAMLDRHIVSPGKVSAQGVYEQMVSIRNLVNYNTEGALPRVMQAGKEAAAELRKLFTESEFPIFNEATKLIREDIALKKELFSVMKVNDEEGFFKVLSSADGLKNKAYLRERVLPVVSKLDARLGSNFKEVLERAMSRESALAGLPEAQKLAQMESALKTLMESKNKYEFEDLVRRSPQYNELINSTPRGIADLAEQKGAGITNAQISSKIRLAMNGDKVALSELKSLGEKIGYPELDKVVERTGVLESFEKDQTRGSRNTLMGTVMGGVFGGPLGGLAGGLLGYEKDKIGGIFYRSLLDGYAQLSAIEGIGKVSSSRILKGIHAAFGVGPDGEISRGLSSRAIAGAVAYRHPIEKLHIGATKMRHADFDEVSEKIARYASDPIAMTDDLGRSIDEHLWNAPQTKLQVMMQMARVVDFLHKKLPKDPTSEFNLGRKSVWRPSDAELAKFGRYYEAAQDPLSIFDYMKKGMMPAEHLEAFQVLYPGMFEQAKMTLVESLVETGENLPYDKRILAGRFLGVPLDPSASIQFFAAMQSLHGANKVESFDQAMSDGFNPKALGQAKLQGGRAASGSEKIMTRA